MTVCCLDWMAWPEFEMSPSKWLVSAIPPEQRCLVWGSLAATEELRARHFALKSKYVSSSSFEETRFAWKPYPKRQPATKPRRNKVAPWFDWDDSDSSINVQQNTQLTRHGFLTGCPRRNSAISMSLSCYDLFGTIKSIEIPNTHRIHTVLITQIALQSKVWVVLLAHMRCRFQRYCVTGADSKSKSFANRIDQWWKLAKEPFRSSPSVRSMEDWLTIDEIGVAESVDFSFLFWWKSSFSWEFLEKIAILKTISSFVGWGAFVGLEKLMVFWSNRKRIRSFLLACLRLRNHRQFHYFAFLQLSFDNINSHSTLVSRK